MIGRDDGLARKTIRPETKFGPCRAPRRRRRDRLRPVRAGPCPECRRFDRRWFHLERTGGRDCRGRCDWRRGWGQRQNGIADRRNHDIRNIPRFPGGARRPDTGRRQHARRRSLCGPRYPGRQLHPAADTRCRTDRAAREQRRHAARRFGAAAGPQFRLGAP